MSKPKHPSQLICLALAVPVTNNRSRGSQWGHSDERSRQHEESNDLGGHSSASPGPFGPPKQWRAMAKRQMHGPEAATRRLTDTVTGGRLHSISAVQHMSRKEAILFDLITLLGGTAATASATLALAASASDGRWGCAARAGLHGSTPIGANLRVATAEQAHAPLSLPGP
jgi:hypothetical protein